MDPLLIVLITAALVGILGFLASLVVRYRQGFFGSLGAGYLGMGIGVWLGGVLHVSEPLPISVGGASVPAVLTFVGALIVLLIAKLLLGRLRRR